MYKSQTDHKQIAQRLDMYVLCETGMSIFVMSWFRNSSLKKEFSI